jgi:hypothetical protein
MLAAVLGKEVTQNALLYYRANAVTWPPYRGTQCLKTLVFWRDFTAVSIKYVFLNFTNIQSMLTLWSKNVVFWDLTPCGSVASYG